MFWYQQSKGNFFRIVFVFSDLGCSFCCLVLFSQDISSWSQVKQESFEVWWERSYENDRRSV